MAAPSHGRTGSFRLYRPIVEHLVGRGVDAGDFLASVDLPHDLLDRPDARLQRPEQEAIWRRAIEVTDDPLLPGRVAQEVRPEVVGVIVYLARASADGVEAVNRVRNFVRLYQDDADLEMDFEADLAVLRVVNRDRHTPILPVCEYNVALHIFIGRALSGDAREAKEVRIPHPAPPHAAGFRTLLGVPVRYGAPSTAVAYRRSAFSRPLREADPGLSDLLEAYAREQLARVPVEDSFTARVRALVERRLSSGCPGIEDVAAELRMSARSVRRKLKEEGSTYRATLDALRRELATRALERGDRGIDAIAADLGFSDGSAFYKAFRRWTGTSPKEFAARRSPGNR